MAAKKKTAPDQDKRTPPGAMLPDLTVLNDHASEEDASLPDRLGFESKLSAALDILRHKNTVCPLTIAIYGDWGTGKTSAMRWLETQLRAWNDLSKTDRKGHPVVYPVRFDPWKYRTREDVWRGLISEVILHCFDTRNLSKKDPLGRMSEAAKMFGQFLGKGFLHALSHVKLSANVGPKSAGVSGEVSGEMFRDIIEEYQKASHPEKAFLNEFESTLKNWIKGFLEKDERMVIFIDDLDRCMPDVTLEVLEALKLYLDIDRLIFVVGLDRAVVDSVVRKTYEDHAPGLDERKSRKYLDKIFQVEIQIPPSEGQMADYFKSQVEELDRVSGKYWSRMFADLGSDDSSYRKPLESVIRKISEHNPREIKRTLNGALLRGHTASENRSLDGGDQLRFAQGVQIFLIQRVIRDWFKDAESLLVQSKVQKWFKQWSDLAIEMQRFSPVEERRSETPEGAKTGEPVPRKVRDGGVDEVPEGMERDTETGLSRNPKYLQLRASQPTYAEGGVVDFLGNELLWELMQVPFSVSVAGAVAQKETLRAGGLASAKPRRSITSEKGTRDGQSSIEDLPATVQNAMAKALSKPVEELSPSDFATLTELDLGESGISEIGFIAGCKSLQKLNLNSTQVSDLSPLASLANLSWLDLRSTQVSDLSPLASLAKLSKLYLSNTQVSDLSPLASLANLSWLDLRSTQVSAEGVAKLEKENPKISIYQ